ncbi:MAG: hypothetical protein EHM48_06000 [Planctomycetaceae bacterium]|nr:MAG: hypothetical protein EHM48_06000 [Planctomycetaceae bacterium]
MILDTHVHIITMKVDPAGALAAMRKAGIDGGVLLSMPPAMFKMWESPSDPKERLENVMQWVQGQKNLFPFFWIDPTEDDALGQVELAVKRGVAGFKIICSGYFPSDERVVKVCTAIAQAGKPILFHSGILWDGLPSSKYNRPAEFEALMQIDGLRFALAHMSWPWVDECLAVFGKIAHARNAKCQMFIDMTPGTPTIYRKEALTKLFTIGYKVADNVLFGTDGRVPEYNSEWPRTWIDRDNAIYDELGLDQEQREKIYCKNLLRFIGTAENKG